MTDDHRPDEVADDRASQAFRDAFDRHAGDLPAGPDLTDVRRRARRRSTLTNLGAAATVVALLGVTFAVTGERSEIEGRTPVADATTAGPSAHVYYSWCFHNGFDDGTRMRSLTKDACTPLFRPPLSLTGASAPLRMCTAS